ncbi:MAG: redoxin domain-containing protein [bacterium]|nr:redoxin domain-containing protein [Candidatus Kapabacteria bacterium]
MQARFHAMTLSRKERLTRFYDAMKARMTDGDETAALPHDADAEVAAALASIDAERDSILRSVAMVHYFTMKSPKHDSSVACRALDEISATSPVWEIDPTAIDVVTRVTGDNDYFESVLAHHPSGSLRAQLMYERLISAHYGEDTAAARVWYTRLLDSFPKSEIAGNARRGYNPDRLVRRGLPLPEFSTKEFGTGLTINRASLAGRYTLIHLWSTWCTSCEMEMANLHAAFEQFAGDRFDILSLSFDISAESVKKYRADKWAMPWTNALVEKGFESTLAESFEVQTIPKPILVDPSGTIVAMESELRGARLTQTLAKFLGDREIGVR